MADSREANPTYTFDHITEALQYMGLESDGSQMLAALQHVAEERKDNGWQVRKIAMVDTIQGLNQDLSKIDDKVRASIAVDLTAEALIYFLRDNVIELTETDAKIRDAAAVVLAGEAMSFQGTAGLTDANEEVENCLAGTGVSKDWFFDYMKQGIRESIPGYEQQPLEQVEDATDFEDLQDMFGYQSWQSLEPSRWPSYEQMWDNTIGKHLRQIVGELEEVA